MAPIFTTLDHSFATPGTTQAFGLNDSDQVVGLYVNPSATHGFSIAAACSAWWTLPRLALPAPVHSASMPRGRSSAITPTPAATTAFS
jgi:hypothetical protein